LSAGEWDRAADEGRGGAVELYLETTVLGMLKTAGRGLRAFSGNLITLAIVLAGLLAFSMLESFAVRSGRSIVQAVLDEMILLRRAAERFGAGDLGYRLPVTGKDEFSVVAGSLNEMAASLKRQQEELVAKERLEEDLRVAREIQQRFLPQGAPGLAGLDVAGVSLPSREVGGDLFYWFAHDDGSLGLALGDVSGKSVPAALLMSNVLSALRAQAMQRIDVAESLTRTNELIIDQIELGRFVTLFYGEVDPRAGELRYACAGHNPPLLLRAGGGIEWLREGGVPIGVLPRAEYAAARVPFAPGDTLIVYSDGVTEAEGPANTPTAPDLFGEERLAAVAAGGGDASARERIDALLQAVERFASGTPQADDIRVLVVRRV